MINIYCDESCHLEHDKARAMLLGAISCPASEKDRVYSEIRSIKKRHGVSSWAEIKWTAVSPSKEALYMALVDYFLQEKSLSFRAVVAKDKVNLNHAKYNSGSHDLWYYKAYYYLLDAMIGYSEEYRIFIDIKDTCGGSKVRKLQEVLCNNKYDFKHEVIKDIEQVKSNESEILQLADLIMGAIGFYHNGHYDKVGASKAKVAVVNRLFEQYKTAIVSGTTRNTPKMNIFLWKLVK
ncbi:MAG: DUF3800 domain-containing protein [Oscillospiraceae bacterium]|jgi:hypothetical protein